MSRKTISRRILRTIAFQSLFQLELNPDLEIYQAIQVALDSHEEFNHLFEDIPFDSQEALLEAYPELSYTFKVIDSVVTNKEAIDQKISQLSTGWSIDRIVRMDLVLLRMAIAEMEYLEDEDVPKAVALNEALEISKVYSDEKSSKFINGVLSNLV
ncbi:transcription antitermination factor NusB [Granulicatella seriolae]|uniref:Transcription antitermination protein NusB n=1 Tax=Granulicatella seriolae TaxID=2967226 RepID=A0ABT1WMR3_9LACT|nr:transcription antitermination factor NusB [Granulicatella seriolae]